jgi:hypothetical protein
MQNCGSPSGRILYVGGKCGGGSINRISWRGACALKNEPTGSRLEYRVRAINKGGESSPTNTISVVL